MFPQQAFLFETKNYFTELFVKCRKQFQNEKAKQKFVKEFDCRFKNILKEKGNGLEQTIMSKLIVEQMKTLPVGVDVRFWLKRKFWLLFTLISLSILVLFAMFSYCTTCQRLSYKLGRQVLFKVCSVLIKLIN